MSCATCCISLVSGQTSEYDEDEHDDDSSGLMIEDDDSDEETLRKVAATALAPSSYGFHSLRLTNPNGFKLKPLSKLSHQLAAGFSFC